jgi:hypothetical protein
MRRIERKTTGARSVSDQHEETAMSNGEQQLPKEDFKFSFVKKSDDEYWFFAWRSWGAMLKVSAKCKECGKLPSCYWGEVSAQGQERKRRMYACSEHFNEVFRMVLEL